MGPASAQTDARLSQPDGGIGTMLGLRVAKINKFRDYPLLCTRVFAPDFRIRPSVLAAYGGVCSFDPPPHPRLGGGLGRNVGTNRVTGLSAHGAEIRHKFFGRFVAR